MATNCGTCSTYVPEMTRLYPLVEEKQKKAIASKKHKENMIYFFKQKVCGIIMLLIGIFCPILLDGDATFSLFAMPMGIDLLITKKRLMKFR